ncbi:phage tail protein [Hahella sp. SMD15-11]|uniref:Phage tail protein n=1 Tax=Thermohahella caldifontis TaxID=3142973 RepID=A0AB39UZK1_9GAMM
MGGSSGASRQIVGYRYYMGMHLVLCHGPVDDITELRMQGRTFWSGSVAGSNPKRLQVDRPNLFGGEKREGGISGAIDVLLGEATQTPNDYLQSRMAGGGTVPAFRGVVGLVLRKCYLAANNPYLKPIAARVRRFLSGWDPAAPNPFSSYQVQLANGMNPAAILYACLTDTRWGMGYAPSMIDTGSFSSASWTLYNEGFGLNLLWTRQSPIEQFVQQVLDHIGGVLVIDASGRFTLRLIREPDLWNARHFGPHNIIALESFERPDWAETVNELTVNYTDRDTGKPKSLTVHNLANIEAQGGVVAERRDYPGITDDALAARVALRDLRSLSIPLARVKLKINPRGDSAASGQPLPGDVIVLDWPELGIAEMVLRVGAIDLGDHTDHSMTLTCVEDVFALGQNAIIGDNDTTWVPDDTSARAPLMSVAVEATYWDLAHTLSRAELGVVEDTDTYLAALAVRNGQAQSEWRLYTGDTAGTAEYRNTAGYSPAARLGADLPQAVDDVTVAVTDLTDAALFADCDYAWLVTTAGHAVEAVGVLAVDEAAGTVTLQRAVLDTVPVAHPAGTWLIGAGPSPGYDATVRAPATSIGVWLEPHTVTDVGTKVAVTGGPTLSLAGRQGLPFPPGNVRINGASYPAAIVGPVSLAWSHRDRTQQTAYLVAQTDGDIGPEPGVTYRVRYYGEAGTLLRTRTGLTATADGWPEEAADSALPGGRLNGHLTVEIDAQRGALDSLHRHRIEVDRAGYGYQYGNYYGGI